MTGSITVLDFHVEKKRVPPRRPSRGAFTKGIPRSQAKCSGVVELFHRGEEPVSVDIFIAALNHRGKVVKRVKRARLLKPNKITRTKFTVNCPSGDHIRWEIEDIHVYEVEYV